MKTNLTKKQLVSMVAILAVGILLAVLILLVKTGKPAAEALEKKPATEALEAKKITGKPDMTGAPESGHAEDKIAVADMQVKSSGITVLTAGPSKISTAITLPGEIHFNEDKTAHVVPRLAGVVESVRASLGQNVSKGEVLAVIASTGLSEQRSELLTAQKKLALTRTTFEREKKLWADKISAEQDYLQARQAMAEAEISLQNAQQKLHALGASTTAGGALNRYELRAGYSGLS